MHNSKSGVVFSSISRTEEFVRAESPRFLSGRSLLMKAALMQTVGYLELLTISINEKFGNNPLETSRDRTVISLVFDV